MHRNLICNILDEFQAMIYNNRFSIQDKGYMCIEFLSMLQNFPSRTKGDIWRSHSTFFLNYTFTIFRNRGYAVISHLWLQHFGIFIYYINASKSSLKFIP
jgi:hypothetical protein